MIILTSYLKSYNWRLTSTLNNPSKCWQSIKSTTNHFSYITNMQSENHPFQIFFSILNWVTTYNGIYVCIFLILYMNINFYVYSISVYSLSQLSVIKYIAVS